MSRRRPNSKGWGSDIRIICTDRGQHAERYFGRVTYTPADEQWHNPAELLFRWRAGVQTLDEMRRSEDVVVAIDLDGEVSPSRGIDDGSDSRKVFVVHCEECGRRVPLREDTFARRVEAMKQLGASHVDISATAAEFR
jgi:hypothetical protein